MAQSTYAPPPPSNHAFVQQQQNFAHPQQPPSKQIVSYDSTQQSTDNQIVPVNNSDSMYYSKTYDEDKDSFNSLNNGFALIAKAFSKFLNSSNNHLRTIQGIKLLLKMER